MALEVLETTGTPTGKALIRVKFPLPNCALQHTYILQVNYEYQNKTVHEEYKLAPGKDTISVETPPHTLVSLSGLVSCGITAAVLKTNVTVGHLGKELLTKRLMDQRLKWLK